MNEINDIQWIIYFGILNVWEAKKVGIPKGRVSPQYKGCRGISEIIVKKRYIESRVFLPFVLLSVIEQTHYQFAGVAAKCFCRPFDTRFILGDKRLGNLKAPTEKANLS